MKTMNLSSAHSSRAFVGPLLLASSILLLPSGVRAQDVGGHWVLDHYELAGTSSGAGAWPSSLLPDQGSISLPGDRQAQAGATATDLSPLPIKLSHAGQVTPVFRWIPDGNDLQAHPAPDQLTIKVTGSAITAYTGNTNQFDVKSNFDIGGASGKASISSMGPYARNLSHNTSFLATVSNTDHQAMVKVPKDGLTVNAGATATLYPGEWSPFSGNLRGGFNIAAIKDDRSVTLSRSVGNDANGIPLETSALGKDGNWHTYGDSIYSAYSVSGLSSGIIIQPAPLDIAAKYSGGWKTTFLTDHWDITPSWNKAGFQQPDGLHNSGQDENHCFGITVCGSPTVSQLYLPPSIQYTGTATGAKTFDTSYTATDNGDQATATAFYHLTLHDPVEQVSYAATTIHAYKPFEADGVVMAFEGPRAASDPAKPAVTIKVGTSTVTGLSLTGTIDAKLFKDVLGFKAEAKQESTKTVDVEVEAKLPEIPDNQWCYLQATHTFTRRDIQYYAYDTSGKIRNMVSAGGVKTEWPQESIEDEAFPVTFDWKFAAKQGFDSSKLPRQELPPLVYKSAPSS